MRQRLMVLLLITACSTVTALPANAQGRWGPGADSSSLRFRVGLFDPAADSSYWDGSLLDFTGSAGDFQDVAVGLDYVWRFSSRSGLMLTFDHWEGDTTQAYRDYVDGGGGDIRHTTTVETSGIGAAWVYHLVDRPAPVSPYLGVGGGLVSWRLEEAGRFIDFTTAQGEIFAARFVDEGTTLAWYALAGVEVGLSPTWSLLVEARWRSADDELSGDFAGLGTLDLSGTELTCGVSLNF